MLKETIRKPEDGRPEKGLHDVTLLKDLGIEKHQSARYQKIATLPIEII